MHLNTSCHPSRRRLLQALLALPAAASGGERSGSDALRADLAQFRDEFFARDRAYSPAARAEAERRLAALEAGLDGLSPVAFALALAQVVALADNGHTISFAGPRAQRYHRVPLRLAPFGSDFHVLRARSAQAELLGAALLAIDGRPLRRLRAAARSLSGGLPAWRDRHAPFLFESPPQLKALGLAESEAVARYRFRLRDGRVVERRLEAEAPGPERPHADTARLLLPEEIGPQRDGLDSGWRGLLPLPRAPWSLREAASPFRWRALPALDALQLELRYSHDLPPARLADFFADVEAALRARRPAHAIVDLRLNSGGDLTKLRDFAERLPTWVPGSIFVLTSPWTFSAAISMTGYLKQAAPPRVQVVGEALGDRLDFHAEGRLVSLANTGELLLYATERHDYVGGCAGLSDCHAPVVERPIRVVSLAPDLAAPWTLAAYAAGRDPALAAVQRRLTRGR